MRRAGAIAHCRSCARGGPVPRYFGLWTPRQSIRVILTYVAEYWFTDYFEKRVLTKRPYLTKELCTRVVAAPIRFERQESNRYRFWGHIPELGGKFLRVVTLDDKVTIHNAFLHRRFKP